MADADSSRSDSQGEAAYEAVQRQFGAVAASYATSAVFALGADLAELVRAVAPTGRERVLDLGTAAGHTALALAPHVESVVGVDITPEMLEQARSLAVDRGVANARFDVADVQGLPFEDRSFDVVVSRFSGHHWPDPTRALHEVARVLGPGGRCFLIDTIGPADPEVDRFIVEFERLRDPSHGRSLTPAEWLTTFAEAALEGVVLRQWDLELDFEDWIGRMQTPPESAVRLRTMLDQATEPIRQVYHPTKRDGRRIFSLPCALMRGQRSG